MRTIGLKLWHFQLKFWVLLKVIMIYIQTKLLKVQWRLRHREGIRMTGKGREWIQDLLFSELRLVTRYGVPELDLLISNGFRLIQRSNWLSKLSEFADTRKLNECIICLLWWPFCPHKGIHDNSISFLHAQEEIKSNHCRISKTDVSRNYWWIVMRVEFHCCYSTKYFIALKVRLGWSETDKKVLVLWR